MYLLTTDVLAIIIALLGASFIIIVSIQAHGRLLRENKELRKEITELQWKLMRGGR